MIMRGNSVNIDILIEGRLKILVDFIRVRGPECFIDIMLRNNVTPVLVKTALKRAGTLTPLVAETLGQRYEAEMTARGLGLTGPGIGMLEHIKILSETRFKAVFLVDKELNLMPEMVLDGNTGLFVSVNKIASELGGLRNYFRMKGNQPTYQVFSHPGMCPVQAAYVVELEQEHKGTQFGAYTLKFYQPQPIKDNDAIHRNTQGYQVAKVTCPTLGYKTISMYSADKLLRTIRTRVFAEKYPDELAKLR